MAECAALGDGGTPFTIGKESKKVWLRTTKKIGRALTSKPELLLTRQFLPSLVKDVVHKSLACHRVLASVAGSATEKHYFGLADDSDSVTEASLRDLAIDLKSLNDLRGETTYGLASTICTSGTARIGSHDSISCSGNARCTRLGLGTT